MCNQWCNIAMGTCFVWCAAGHCYRSTVVSLYINDIVVGIESEILRFVCSLMTVSAIIRLIALKTHRNSKRISINWANRPGNGV